MPELTLRTLPAFAVPFNGCAGRPTDPHTLAAALRKVETEIRQAFAAGFSRGSGMVPYVGLFDDGEPVYMRVEVSFRVAMAEAVRDPDVFSYLQASMIEPEPARSHRLLRQFEAAVLDFHLRAHADKLARLLIPAA